MIEEISHMTAIVVEENQENAPFFPSELTKKIGWLELGNKQKKADVGILVQSKLTLTNGQIRNKLAIVNHFP